MKHQKIESWMKTGSAKYILEDFESDESIEFLAYATGKPYEQTSDALFRLRQNNEITPIQSLLSFFSESGDVGINKFATITSLPAGVISSAFINIFSDFDYSEESSSINKKDSTGRRRRAKA